jgi:hypothetical protein
VTKYERDVFARGAGGWIVRAIGCALIGYALSWQIGLGVWFVACGTVAVLERHKVG